VRRFTWGEDVRPEVGRHSRHNFGVDPEARETMAQGGNGAAEAHRVCDAADGVLGPARAAIGVPKEREIAEADLLERTASA
jgi:hypothetical protein